MKFFSTLILGISLFSTAAFAETKELTVGPDTFLFDAGKDWCFADPDKSIDEANRIEQQAKVHDNLGNKFVAFMAPCAELAGLRAGIKNELNQWSLIFIPNWQGQMFDISGIGVSPFIDMVRTENKKLETISEEERQEIDNLINKAIEGEDMEPFDQSAEGFDFKGMQAVVPDTQHEAAAQLYMFVQNEDDEGMIAFMSQFAINNKFIMYAHYARAKVDNAIIQVKDLADQSISTNIEINKSGI